MAIPGPPAGCRIAFVRNHELYVLGCSRSGIPVRGARPARICAVPRGAFEWPGSRLDEDAEWTPSGKIAFLPADSPNSVPRIAVVRPVPGARPETLARGYDPAFSPDGSRLAYSVDRSTGANMFTSDLRIMDLRSERSRVFIRDADLAAWSADGKRIAYATWAGDHADERVVVADASSGKVLSSFECGNPCDIRFSPNGRMLAIHDHLSRPLTGHEVIDLKSGESVEVDQPDEYAPGVLEDWGPNSRSALLDWRIVDPNNDGNWIRQYEAICRLDRKKSRLLVSGRRGRFTPDGKALLYIANPTKPAGDLCRRPIDGHGKRTVIARGVSQFSVSPITP